jgi:ribosomal protein L14
VRVKKELQRVDGTVVRFGDNACVLVNKSGDPIGTRMTGTLYSERSDSALRNKGAC